MKNSSEWGWGSEQSEEAATFEGQLATLLAIVVYLYDGLWTAATVALALVAWYDMRNQVFMT